MMKKNSENDSDGEELIRAVQDCVFEDSKEYNKMLNQKGQHYLEQIDVVYTKFKDIRNKLFVTKGNYDIL